MDEIEERCETRFEEIKRTDTSSETSSISGGYEDTEDYFLKYNTMTGCQSFILVQFQNQMTIFILTGIFFGYIKAIIDAALVLGRTDGRILTDPTAIKGMIYSFDLFYLSDLICMVIYKHMIWQGLSVRYKSRHGLILFLEFASVIPLEGIYTTMINHPNPYAYYCLRLRYTLRWCRLYSFVTQISNYVGVNSHLLHLMVYVSFIITTAVTVGCISYTVECRLGNLNCNNPETYYDLISQHIYLTGCRLFMIGITAMIESTVMHNVFGSFLPYIISIHFLSFYIINVMQTLHGRFNHLNMFTWLSGHINKWKVRYGKEWKSFHLKYELLVHQSNSIVWAKTKGCPANVYLGKVLPPIMYQEIQLDISWGPLKHSHLFRDEDIFFLRAVSEVMQHKYVYPGEVIYKRDQFKNDMVYVKSGIVEILSEEDGETPIFSLTSGTCLGESTLCVSFPSTCTVIAKDTCDLAILNRKGFLRLRKMFPLKIRKINEDVRKRYTYAKRFRKLSLYQMRLLDLNQRIGIITMKWVKLIMRTLLCDQIKSNNFHDRQHLANLESIIFCPKYLDLLVKAEDIQLVSDSVFLRNKFPFIFRPNSILLKTWSMFVLLMAILLGISFPYFTVFRDDMPFSYKAFYSFITFLWLIDLYLKSSTALETKHTYIINIGEIIIGNLTNIAYVLDILSVLPFEYFIHAIEGSLSKYEVLVAHCNRLLKLYRLEVFFQNLNLTVSAHVFFLYIKFYAYFAFTIYYLAGVLYMIGNNPENAIQFTALLKRFDVNDTVGKLFLSLSQAVCYIGSISVSPFPFVYNWESCIVLILFQVGMGIFCMYFCAQLSSGHTLMQQHSHQKLEFLRNLDVTMKCFNIEKKLQARVWRYVNLQFQATATYFLSGTKLLEPLPHDLAIMTHGIAVGDLIKNQLLFMDLNDSMLTLICSITTVHLLPATETIKDMGGVCREIHILTNGVCARTDLNGRTKTIYPGECFSLLESCLGIPSMVTVKAITTCQIISINFAKLKALFLRYPQEYGALQTTIERFKFLENIGILLTNSNVIRTEVVEPPKQLNVKSFGYFLKPRTRKYYTYDEGFPKWAFIFKYVLLRYTFYSNGRFVFYWEISRAIFALLTNFLFPFLALFKDTRRGSILKLFIFCLDTTALVDIYMRHHFTYFNENGLEVSHPFYTAHHYWTHSFVIDVLGCIPLRRLSSLLITPRMYTPFYLNRLLQLYRWRALYNHIFRGVLGWKGTITMLRYLPYLIISFNIASSLTFVGFCTIAGERVICDKNTWICKTLSKYHFNKFDAYILSIVFTVGGVSLNSFKIIEVSTLREIGLVCVEVLVCLSLHLYLIAKIVDTSLTINRDLNAYQEAMRSLVTFLRYRKIDKNIKTEIVNHFEYMWYKTRGKSIHTSFLPFKSSFKVEALYSFYGPTFQQSTIFPPPNSSFFKILLLDIKHEIYLKTGILYSVNDVHGDIFILFKGEVEVVGADLNKLLTLRVGSVFGNLDNCPKGRRTLSMVASGHVEVLKFSSSVFHEHLKKFPELRKHFMNLTVFNVDFLEETSIQTSKSDKKLTFLDVREPRSRVTVRGFVKQLEPRRQCKVFVRNRMIAFWENVILNVIYFIDYVLHLYGISTQTPTLAFILLVYFIDALYLVKIYIKFCTAFEDDFGHPIYSAKEVAKHYMKRRTGFHFDLATVIPFELITLFFLHSPYRKLVWTLCRTNRLLRIILLLSYLHKSTQKLNISVFTMKTIFLLTKIVLAQVTLAACVQMMRGKVIKSVRSRLDSYSTAMMLVTNASWKFEYDLTFIRMNRYTIIISLFITFLSRYISWYFISEGCGQLYTVNWTRSVYEQFFKFMKNYMYNENVSTPLIERVHAYIELLWIHNHGIQFPKLLDEAPYYLKEAVLNSMFGYHLMEHPLLQHCHKDMARQMASCMKTLVFFPGDIVVYAGDVDSCMYFIHEGEIHALSEDTLHSEVVDNILDSGDMFGLDQGLYEKCGHEYTYKAVKHSVLISLCRNDWIYLLDFFPASKNVIYDRTVYIAKSKSQIREE